MKKTGIVLGGFLLLCGTVPLLYGVKNIGCLALLVMGCAVWLAGWFWHSFAGPVRKAAKLCAAAVLVVYLGVSALMAQSAWLSRPPEGCDAPVIVLGGHVYEHGPSLMVAYRLDAAAAYLKDNPEVICVVSGGQGANEPRPEGEVMAEYLIDRHGIDPARVIQENRSTNTQENLRYSRGLLDGGQSAVIVTNDFHQMRARLLAEKEGFSRIYSVPARTPYGLIPAYWTRDLLGVLATALFI